MSGEPSFNYSVFGLHVRSSIELPELIPVGGRDEPDVIVERGNVPEGADGAGGVTLVDGSLVFAVAGVARYRISEGSRITVDVAAGVPDGNARLYLLGSAFGALLHQRGLMPLHANAVEIDGKAVAFMGKSGVGKSTLAAWFHDRGLRVLADDVCVVDMTSEGPVATVGIQRLRLWRDTVKARGLEPSALEPSYSGDPEFDKFDVPITTASSANVRLPLAAVYVLDEASQPGISPLAGVDAVEQLFAHTYRGAFVPLLGAERRHWSSCVRLVSEIPLFRFARHWGLAEMEPQNLLVLEHAKALLAN